MEHDGGSDVLGSLIFLLTGTNKAALRAKIRALGGTVLDLLDWQVSSELLHAMYERYRVSAFSMPPESTPESKTVGVPDDQIRKCMLLSCTSCSLQSC